MEPSDELKSEVLRLYNQNPVGWYVLVARDVEGHIDTVFIRGEDAWFLKEEQTSPYERVGVGEKISVNGLDRYRYTSFGFRPIPQAVLKQIGMSRSSPRNIDLLLETLLKTKPLPLHSIKSPVFIEGPIIVQRDRCGRIFESQKELDLKLRRELNRLLDRRYPHLRRIYG